MFADANNTVTGNLIYGNTISGNRRYGLEVRGPYGGYSNGCTNNLVKNNIIVNTQSGPNLQVFDGCENGANGSGNVYTYNDFGAAASNFIWWGGSSPTATYYSTYVSWEAAAGNCGTTGCSHSVQSDPLFLNASIGNFTLQASSPAIGAGVNLGSTYEMALNPNTSFPYGTVNQNSYGSGWEIGAFAFVQQVTVTPAPPTSLSLTVQ